MPMWNRPSLAPPNAAEPDDCILVFGSFMTVEVALRNRTVGSV
jgi:hypothetical protein